MQLEVVLVVVGGLLATPFIHSLYPPLASLAFTLGSDEKSGVEKEAKVESSRLL